MNRLAIAASMILLGALASGARAEAPNLLTYQGRLKEAGSPVSGPRQVQVYLCDSETAGTCAGTGEQPVAVANALFRTTFTVPSSVDLNTGSWWLEVRLGAGGTTILSPRERLSSSPYAVVASTAAGLLAPAGRNVGIGVAAPTASLHVSNQSATSADTVLKVSSGTGVGQELLVVKGDGKVDVVSWKPGALSNRYFSSGGGNTTTTSTSYVDLMTLTVQTSGGDLMIDFSGQFSNTSGSNNTYIQLVIDGVAEANSERTIAGFSTGSYSVPLGLSWLKMGLGAGSHSIKIQWRVSGGTGTANDNLRFLRVVELKG